MPLQSRLESNSVEQGEWVSPLLHRMEAEDIKAVVNRLSFEPGSRHEPISRGPEQEIGRTRV
jgi:hypothetical protein